MTILRLLPHQRRLWRAARSSPSPGRFAAANAIRSVFRAWRLRRIDPEMAVFRAMTAEEESVTAIFRALEFRQYPQAQRLKRHKHAHKAALQPFLDCVQHALATSEVMRLRPQVAIGNQSQGSQLKIRLRVTAEDGEAYAVCPVPPLGGEYFVNGERYDFRRERALLLSQSTEMSMEDHLRKLANERNELLYAAVEGIPKIGELKEWYFERQRDRVFRNVTIYLLVVQEPVHQAFVEQTLDAFLDMLGRIARKEQKPPDE